MTSQSSRSVSGKQGSQKPHSSCPSPQQSRAGTAQAENQPCGCCDIFPQVILTHFSMHFLRDKAHQTDISAASTAPLIRHSSDLGARTLWGRGSEGSQGIMKIGMVSRLSRRFHLKLTKHWGHALPAAELWILTGCNLPLVVLDFAFPAFLAKLWKLG